MIARLAWRSIWRNRRRTLITVLSIGFGLACTVFFIAIGEGVYAQLIDQVVRLQAGHITMEHPGYRDAPAVDLWVKAPESLRSRIERLPQVERTKLIILGQGIARSGSGDVSATLMGIEPSVELDTSPLVRHIVAGRYLNEDDGPWVVIGSELAKRLKLKVGKKMVLTTNDAAGNLVDVLCRVRGIFETGSVEIDGYFIQAPIDFARRLFGLPEESATQLGVVLRIPEAQESILQEVRLMVAEQDIAVLPWQEVIPEIASYIKLDKGSNWIFQAILVFLILFTIFNTILMSVLEREREFAVLLALGTKPVQLRLQILMESAYLGLIGCALGLLVGGLAAWAAQVWGIDLRSLLEEGFTISGFAISAKMHARVTTGLLLGTAGLVFGATLILSLIPMHRATRLSIVDQLR
ncbi:MAG: ABC transporter permease [Syntrophobacterales bacterium]|jgi:ABC-type lipoprotein release transport system permease subunit